MIGISSDGRPGLGEIDQPVAAPRGRREGRASDRMAGWRTPVAATAGRLDGIGGNVAAGTEAVNDVGDTLGDKL